jgi:hypothetical protein
MNASKPLALCAAALLTLCAPAQSQPVTNLATAFSATSNPNGNWTFGWIASGGSTFTPYTTTTSFLGGVLNEWHDPSLTNGVPLAAYNPTSSVINYSSLSINPQSVFLHPGENNESSVARWISPFSGSIYLSAGFQGVDTFGTTTGVGVFLNNSSLFSGAVNGFGNQSNYVAPSLSINSGDILDFRVNFGTTDYFNDSTQLNVLIDRVAVSAIPEVSEVLMLSFGITTLVGLQRRKKSRQKQVAEVT